MRVKITSSCGKICFTLVADSDADMAVLGVFAKQSEDCRILISDRYDVDAAGTTELYFYAEENTNA